jgi:hypothetical protein
MLAQGALDRETKALMHSQTRSIGEVQVKRHRRSPRAPAAACLGYNVRPPGPLSCTQNAPIRTDHRDAPVWDDRWLLLAPENILAERDEAQLAQFGALPKSAQHLSSFDYPPMPKVPAGLAERTLLTISSLRFCPARRGFTD